MTIPTAPQSEPGEFSPRRACAWPRRLKQGPVRMILPEELRSWILHEDDRLLVIDKPGDVVLPYKSNQIFLRGGYHRLIFEDKEVLALAKDLPLERLSVGGKPLKPTEEGKFELPAVQS